MNRFLRHYNPKMPFYLARQAQIQGYDPERFISWYLSYPDIAENYTTSSPSSSKLSRYLQYYCYYFWMLYLASTLISVFVAPLVGIIGILISPYVVAGSLYALLFVLWYLKLLGRFDKNLIKAKSSQKKTAKKNRPTGDKR